MSLQTLVLLQPVCVVVLCCVDTGRLGSMGLGALTDRRPVLVFDDVPSDFRGGGGRVQQVGGDAARPGRTLQGAEVSPSVC